MAKNRDERYATTLDMLEDLKAVRAGQPALHARRIVTLEDLVEEIVGDVRDEHDRQETAQIRRVDERSWIISGLLRTDEVADAVADAVAGDARATPAAIPRTRLRGSSVRPARCMGTPIVDGSGGWPGRNGCAHHESAQPY